MLPPPASRVLLALLAALALLLPAPAMQAADDETAKPNPDAPATPAPPHREPVPPPPTGLLLDQAHVLLPEATALLSARLVAARAADVHVYVVTIRSLGVPPSKQGDQLQETVRDFLKAWLPHEVGAVILFDDESGLMTVELSKETDQRFASFAVERDLRELLAKAQESGLAREKLEQIAQIVAETLSQRQTTWAKAARKERTANLIMGTVALLGIGLAVFSAIGKPKTPATATPAAASENPPPPDF